MESKYPGETLRMCRIITICTFCDGTFSLDAAHMSWVRTLIFDTLLLKKKKINDAPLTKNKKNKYINVLCRVSHLSKQLPAPTVPTKDIHPNVTFVRSKRGSPQVAHWWELASDDNTMTVAAAAEIDVSISVKFYNLLKYSRHSVNKMFISAKTEKG